MARKKNSTVLQFAWIRNTCKLLRNMGALKTVKKKEVVLSSIYLQSRPPHLKQKKMNSRSLQKIWANPQFFSDMKPAPVSVENMAPLPLHVFTVRHSKHEKQRTCSESRKTLETSESATQTSEMPSEASETHRKDIEKERHRKGIGKTSERHRKGIGKHLEILESMGKHRKASENIGTPL